MTKAVLVIDMPENCGSCLFCKSTYSVYCEIESKTISNTEIKPDWCPLKPLPKRSELSDNDYRKPENQWQCGWDACIKKITEQ